ncbi:MAG TPA: FAD-dependent monooxygenase [Ktedonobacteraceae bacterium]|nr:FAD-dependent monooxygenase [Ktedonobacteraceae bacterium]
MSTHAQSSAIPTRQQRGGCALIIGSGLAGLFTARVLSDFFARVIIIERDVFPEQPDHRKGAPQSHHTHGLSGRGQVILNQFFPGLFADLRADGADSATNMVAMVMVGPFGKLATQKQARESLRFSRYLLEWHVYKRLEQRPEIEIVTNCEVTELLTTPDRSRVIGVKTRARGATGEIKDFAADLVVDASGRNSQLPNWLKTLGYDAPPEERVDSGLGYASRFYEKPADFPNEWQNTFILPRYPDSPRSGTIAMVEHNRWHVTLGGVAGHFPPTDEEGFLRWAQELPDPTVYECLRIARPLTPIRGYRIRENHIRHYEQLTRWPAGLLVIGDAICALNPIRGQGMALSAMEALTLNQCFAEQQKAPRPEFERHVQQQLHKTITDPWRFTLAEDMRWPGVTHSGAPLPLGFRLWQRYIDLVLRSAVNDSEVSRAFLTVYGMLEPQSSLARPRILWRVLRDSIFRKGIPDANNPFALSTKALAQLRNRPASAKSEGIETREHSPSS